MFLINIFKVQALLQFVKNQIILTTQADNGFLIQQISECIIRQMI